MVILVFILSGSVAVDFIVPGCCRQNLIFVYRITIGFAVCLVDIYIVAVYIKYGKYFCIIIPGRTIKLLAVQSQFYRHHQAISRSKAFKAVLGFRCCTYPAQRQVQSLVPM